MLKKEEVIAQVLPQLLELSYEHYRATKKETIFMLRDFRLQSTFTLSAGNEIVAVVNQTKRIQ